MGSRTSTANVRKRRGRDGRAIENRTRQYADQTPDQQLLVLDPALWAERPALMGRTAVTFGEDFARTFCYTLGSKLAALIYMSKVAPPSSHPSPPARCRPRACRAARVGAAPVGGVDVVEAVGGQGGGGWRAGRRDEGGDASRF